MIAAAIAAAFAGGLLLGRDRSPGQPRAVEPVTPVPAAVPISASTLRPVLTLFNPQGPDPHDIDLADVVPRGGVVDGVWFVPAGSTAPQLAVVWHRASRWHLTLWTPKETRYSGTRWRPQRLIKRSPIPMTDWQGNSGLRLADVTRDGHADLLVSVGIPGTNHGVTLISVFDGSAPYSRIYGFGSAEVDKLGTRAYGRNIFETYWGARDGMLWFDEPRGGQSLCCPDYRLKYELRWNGRGWDRISERRVPLHYG